MLAVCLLALSPMAHDPIAPAPDVPAEVVTEPLPWVRRPVIVYPPLALQRDLWAAVTVHCTVQSDGNLTDCVVVSEDPPGYGFGEAAAAAMSDSQVEDRLAGSVVQQRFRFSTAQRPAGSSSDGGGDGAD